VAVTDHPRQYAATPGRWGVAHAALRDGLPPWLDTEIASARARGELVIAFPHWGPNMATAPEDWQRRVAAGLHAAGADLIAGHSAHVFTVWAGRTGRCCSTSVARWTTIASIQSCETTWAC
jgi:Bacterial capsule synthesis protein PGA_cap